MPYCPSCKQQFADELKNCPDDGAELVGELPYQTVEGPGSTWVEIESAGTEEDANLMKGFLEAAGIPAQIESLKFTMEPVNLGSMGEVRVYVAAENEQEAVRLLRERRDETMVADGTVMTDDGPATIDDNAETVAESEEP
jgi:hypothetical protein